MTKIKTIEREIEEKYFKPIESVSQVCFLFDLGIIEIQIREQRKAWVNWEVFIKSFNKCCSWCWTNTSWDSTNSWQKQLSILLLDRWFKFREESSTEKSVIGRKKLSKSSLLSVVTWIKEIDVGPKLSGQIARSIYYWWVFCSSKTGIREEKHSYCNYWRRDLSNRSIAWHWKNSGLVVYCSPVK